MSFEQLLAILRARWMIVVGVFVAVLTAVTVYTLLVSKTYTAAGSVVVDIKSPDPIAGMVLTGVAQPSFLMTQIDIISSSRVAQRVVKNLKLDQNPQMREQWKQSTGGQGDFGGWVAMILRSGIAARPSRGSNVIGLTYESADPYFAAAIVNAFIDAYLETSVEMRTEPAKQFNAQFDINAKAMTSRLEEAQARLSEFQQKNGLIVTDERLDIETARLNELSSQLVALQTAKIDSGSRQVAAQTRVDMSPDVMANPLVNSLKADLARYETQLQQLSQRLGDQHPQVRELRASVTDLRQKVDTEMKRVVGSVGVNNNVNSSRVAQLEASLAEQRAKVLKMKSLRDQATTLERDVVSAQRALEGVTARLQNTNLESMALQSNVFALERAVVPSVPTSPRVFSNIVLGAAVAGVLGVALGLLIELRDRRLRTPKEIEAVLQQALIGTIPSFKKKQSFADLPSRLSLRSGTEKDTPRLTHS